MTSERPTPEATAEPATSKLPPFKRGVLPAIGQPLTSVLPSAKADGAATEAPSTLLFNDVADDALMCDPNDPDCELV